MGAAFVGFCSLGAARRHKTGQTLQRKEEEGNHKLFEYSASHYRLAPGGTLKNTQKTTTYSKNNPVHPSTTRLVPAVLGLGTPPQLRVVAHKRASHVPSTSGGCRVSGRA
jgi:hypothetical protein